MSVSAGDPLDTRPGSFGVLVVTNEDGVDFAEDVQGVLNEIQRVPGSDVFLQYFPTVETDTTVHNVMIVWKDRE